MRLVGTYWLLPRSLFSASTRSSLSSLARTLFHLPLGCLDRWSLELVFEPRKTSSTVRTRQTAHNFHLLSMVSILLFALFPPFLVCYSSADSSTDVRYGNVSEHSLIPGKRTHILFGCIENHLYILVILELMCTLILGTVYPPSHTLHSERVRSC